MRSQELFQAAVTGAGRLEHDQCRRTGSGPFQKALEAGRVVAKLNIRTVRATVKIERALRNVDSYGVLHGSFLNLVL